MFVKTHGNKRSGLGHHKGDGSLRDYRVTVRLSLVRGPFLPTVIGAPIGEEVLLVELSRFQAL